MFFLYSFQVVQKTWEVDNLYFMNYYLEESSGVFFLKYLNHIKIIIFVNISPKLPKTKSTLRPKNSIKKQLVKKSTKKHMSLSPEETRWSEYPDCTNQIKRTNSRTSFANQTLLPKTRIPSVEKPFPQQVKICDESCEHARVHSTLVVTDWLDYPTLIPLSAPLSTKRYPPSEERP